MKKNLLLIFLLFVSQVSMSSCSDEYETENQHLIPTEDGSFTDSQFLNFEISLYSDNSRGNQSAAIFGDYVFLVTDQLNTIHLYNIKNKRYLCKKTFEKKTDLTPGGYVLYHCNQMTCGVDYYAPDDPFPLLYISQRCRSDYRYFVEVYRIMPTKSDSDNDYSAMDAQLVQTIYFPQMSEDNSLGNVNCVIDSNTRMMYTYSRNNDKSAENYRKCKISCFDIPDFHDVETYLEDNDIKSSFMLGCSAVNMQGGCVKDGKLFIGQGSKSAGYIYLNIVDLAEQKLLRRIDLLAQGITWEPEGCFAYNGNIMVCAGKNIWQFHFEEEEPGGNQEQSD